MLTFSPPKLIKLEPFQARRVTELYFPQFVSDPGKINYGQCFMWAYLAYQTFSGIELWDTHGHAFVRHQGKFYDSDRPDGEEDWHDLPAVSYLNIIPFFEKEAYKLKRHTFQKHWKHQLRKFNTSWGQMNKLAEGVLRHEQRIQSA